MKIQIITLSAVLIFGNLFAQTITNYTTTDGLLNDNVICVAVDGSNTLWFGTQMGVSVFDGVNWSSHTTTTDPGLVDNNIQAIYCAANGESNRGRALTSCCSCAWLGWAHKRGTHHAKKNDTYGSWLGTQS